MNPLANFGLAITEHFIDALAETELLAAIWRESVVHPDRVSMDKPGGRSKIIRYGYDYTSAKIKPWLRSIPAFLIPTQNAIESLIGGKFDSITINEYLKGHFIAPHIDSTDFANKIAILSLNSSCEMFFQKQTERHVIYMPRRSLTVMQNEIRYNWKHSTLPAHNIRYSVVFRTRV